MGKCLCPFLRLMEKILHQLGWSKHCYWWDIVTPYQLMQDLVHQTCDDHINEWLVWPWLWILNFLLFFLWSGVSLHALLNNCDALACTMHVLSSYCLDATNLHEVNKCDVLKYQNWLNLDTCFCLWIKQIQVSWNECADLQIFPTCLE